MKKKLMLGLAVLGSFSLQAQDEIQTILRAGVEDATRFSESYIAPAAGATIYSLANGWYNSGEAKKHYILKFLS